MILNLIAKSLLFCLLLSTQSFAALYVSNKRPSPEKEYLFETNESLHFVKKSDAGKHLIFEHRFSNGVVMEVINYKLTLAFDNTAQMQNLFQSMRIIDTSQGCRQDLFNFSFFADQHLGAHHNADLKERDHTHFSFMEDERNKRPISPLSLAFFLRNIAVMTGFSRDEIAPVMDAYSELYQKLYHMP